MIRNVPVRWESDVLHPFGSYYSYSTPGYSSYSTYSSSSSGGGDLGRSYTRPPSYIPPFPTDPFPLEASQRRAHFDDRAAVQFNSDVQRMNQEMAKMSDNMRQKAPLGSVDELRLTENFRNENPIIQDADGFRRFKLQFDVRQFRPEEIKIKTSGNQLSIHAKHEDKSDAGKSMMREYSRQYVLPREVNPEYLTSKLSYDGVLTVEAPLPALECSRDQAIPIQHRK